MRGTEDLEGDVAVVFMKRPWPIRISCVQEAPWNCLIYCESKGGTNTNIKIRLRLPVPSTFKAAGIYISCKIVHCVTQTVEGKHVARLRRLGISRRHFSGCTNASLVKSYDKELKFCDNLSEGVN